jgi:hypothetical protein
MSSSLKLTEKWLFVALNVVCALGFLVYHIGLDRYYCLSADDFAGIDYAAKGIPGLGYAWRFYFAWEGPFLSFFIQGLLMSSVAAGIPAFIGLLIIKLGLVNSTMVLLRSVSKRFELNWSAQQICLAALLFNICLYVISPEPSQVWHWLIGISYLVPLIFLQLGTAALLRNKFWWATAALAFVMQSRATYAVLIFGFIVLLTIFNWWKRAENRKQWLLLSIFLFSFLLLYLIAPGNYIRLNDSHHPSLIRFIAQFKNGLHNLFVSFNIAKMDRVLFALLAVLPWVGLCKRVPRPQQLWQWTVPSILYLGFAIAHEILFVYIAGTHEWHRVLSLHSFLFLVMTFVYGFWFYGLVPIEWRMKARFVSVIGVIGILYQLFNGFGAQLEMGREFKANYDSRMASILEFDGVSDTLYVQPLNYTGFLYFEDFSEDPDHWINYDFCKAYNLDFKIALQPQNHE